MLNDLWWYLMKFHNFCHLKPPPIEPMTWSRHWITGPLGWPKALLLSKKSVTHVSSKGMEFSIFLFQIYHKQAAQISLFPCHIIQNFHVGIVPIPGFIQVLFDTSYFFGHSQCPKGAVRRQNTPKRLSSAGGQQPAFGGLSYTWLMYRILVCRLECTGVHNMTMCLYVAPKKRKQSFCASMTNQAHTCHIHLLEQHIERKPKCIRINTNESQQTPLGTSSWFVCV